MEDEKLKRLAGIVVRNHTRLTLVTGLLINLIEDLDREGVLPAAYRESRQLHLREQLSACLDDQKHDEADLKKDFGID